LISEGISIAIDGRRDKVSVVGSVACGGSWVLVMYLEIEGKLKRWIEELDTASTVIVSPLLVLSAKQAE
jgi:hypothetical protein